MMTMKTMTVGHATCQASCHQSWHVSGCPSLHDTDSQSRASSSRWQWRESPFCKNNSYNLFIDGFPNIKSRSQFQSEKLFIFQKPWSFFVHRHNPDIGFGWRQNVVPIPRQGSDFVPRGRPVLQWLQHQLFLNSGFSHAPPLPFLVRTNLQTKDSRNVRNCGIHFSEIVSLFCKIASYIIYPSKTRHLFNITWDGLDSWEIAGLDPHSNCGGFDESICRLVSSACVTGANCVCIGFIISNITCRPTLPQWCAI